MKYASKQDLLADIEREHEALTARLETLPNGRVSEPGVWGDDWTVTDLVAHLAEWHSMLLGWYSEGLAGRKPDLPAPGYRWNETPALNRSIQEKHAGRSYDSVKADFDETFDRVLDLVTALPEPKLLEPGHFAWTGRNALVTYVGANTASHYRFASKVIRRWLRQSSDPDRK